MTLEIWVSLSRYCIERVFRPRKLDRFHPKELLECAFDIVTSTTNSSLPTAEIIYTIYEIIQEFPALQVPFRILTFRGYPFRALHQTWGEAPTVELLLSVCWQWITFLLKQLKTAWWYCFWGLPQALTSAFIGKGFAFVCFVLGEGWCFSDHSSKVQELRLRSQDAFGTFIRCSEPSVVLSSHPISQPPTFTFCPVGMRPSQWSMLLAQGFCSQSSRSHTHSLSTSPQGYHSWCSLSSKTFFYPAMVWAFSPQEACLLSHWSAGHLFNSHWQY